MSKNGEDRVLGHCPHARGIYSDNARTEPRSRTRTGEQQSWRRPRSADRGRLSWIGGTSPEGKFPMEPEEEWVRGPFRKETEDRTVWVGRDKVPEGTQERSGKGAVWTWARQDNYPTLSECEHVKARLSDKKGLYFEGWPRLVRTRGLEGSELYCQCDSGQADSKQPLGLAGLSPGPASGWYLQYKIVSPGQSMPLLSNMSNTELSCSHVLIQRSLFSFRIGSQTCSQSWCFSSLLPITFFIFQEEVFWEAVLTSCILPWGPDKQPQGSGSCFTEQPWFSGCWNLAVPEVSCSCMNSFSFMGFIRSWWISHSLPCFAAKILVLHFILQRLKWHKMQLSIETTQFQSRQFSTLSSVKPNCENPKACKHHTLGVIKSSKI